MKTWLSVMHTGDVYGVGWCASLAASGEPGNCVRPRTLLRDQRKNVYPACPGPWAHPGASASNSKQ